MCGKHLAKRKKIMHHWLLYLQSVLSWLLLLQK